MVFWTAGEIIGASTDSMEEESCKEGWRRLEGAFSLPPDKRPIFFGSAVSAKHGSRPAPERIRS
jgi:hypothetical protein